MLYYFILPSTKRDIPELNLNDYNSKFPNSEYAKIIFGDFLKDNENLFRFMAHIYNKLKLYKKDFILWQQLMTNIKNQTNIQSIK